MIHFLDLLGVAVFAISGSLAAGRKRLDLFGVCVLGLVTAAGGGTLRDILLGIRPVFWIADPSYIYVAVGASVLTFVSVRFRRTPGRLLLIADAFGLALFTVLGTEKALLLDVPWVVAVIMGIMTGVAGGMVRDLLTGEIPLILRREIYATASLVGAVAFVMLFDVFPNRIVATLFAALVTLVLRLAAIKWNLSLPVLLLDDDVSRR